MQPEEKALGLVGSVLILLTLVGLAIWRMDSLTTVAEMASPRAQAAVTHVRPTSTLPPISSTTIPTATSTLTATQTNAPVAVNGQAPVPVLHVIQRGEDLYQIAHDYDVSLPDLAAVNHITDTSQIIAGQVLTIPLTPPPKSLPTAGPSPTPVPTEAVGDGQVSINGVPLSDFVVITEQVRQNIRRLYKLGQTLGNRPNAFSSVGDSTMEYPYFMTGFDHPGHYNLGPYTNLQAAIDYFSGSFDRQSMGVMRGLRASTALDPFWADKTLCQANESRVACEYRLNKPSIVFIRLGSNEGQPKSFDKYLRIIVDYWVNHGVVPIMGTKADRVEGPDNADNQAIRQIAIDYQIPLWDFDLLAQTVPGGVVGHDGIHLTSYPTYDFSAPEAFQRGYGLHNLTGLMALNEVWHILSIAEPGAQ